MRRHGGKTNPKHAQSALVAARSQRRTYRHLSLPDVGIDRLSRLLCQLRLLLPQHDLALCLNEALQQSLFLLLDAVQVVLQLDRLSFCVLTTHVRTI